MVVTEYVQKRFLAKHLDEFVFLTNLMANSHLQRGRN